jgi:hypothetical protein
VDGRSAEVRLGPGKVGEVSGVFPEGLAVDWLIQPRCLLCTTLE